MAVEAEDIPRGATFVTVTEIVIEIVIVIETVTVTFVTFEMARPSVAIQTVIGAGGIVISMPVTPVSAFDVRDHRHETFEMLVTPVAGMATSFECVEIPVTV